MQQQDSGHAAQRRTPWKAYRHRDRARIDEALSIGGTVTCPCCTAQLAARPTTRLRTLAPTPPDSYDLECHSCRRFHPVVPAGSEALYLVRLRRLATAVLRA